MGHGPWGMGMGSGGCRARARTGLGQLREGWPVDRGVDRAVDGRRWFVCVWSVGGSGFGVSVCLVSASASGSGSWVWHVCTGRVCVHATGRGRAHTGTGARGLKKQGEGRGGRGEKHRAPFSGTNSSRGGGLPPSGPPFKELSPLLRRILTREPY